MTGGRKMTYEEYRKKWEPLYQLLQLEEERERKIPLGAEHLDEVFKQRQVCRDIEDKMDKLRYEYLGFRKL